MMFFQNLSRAVEKKSCAFFENDFHSQTPRQQDLVKSRAASHSVHSENPLLKMFIGRFPGSFLVNFDLTFHVITFHHTTNSILAKTITKAPTLKPIPPACTASETDTSTSNRILAGPVSASYYASKHGHLPHPVKRISRPM